jgi:hypothetical protein
MRDLVDMKNTHTEDEEGEYYTFGNTTPRDDHDHAQIQAESEVT